MFEPVTGSVVGKQKKTITKATYASPAMLTKYPSHVGRRKLLFSGRNTGDLFLYRTKIEGNTTDSKVVISAVLMKLLNAAIATSRD